MKVQDDAVWKTAQGRLRDRLGAARLLPWVDEIAVANVDRARGWATLEATSYDSAQSARKFEDAIATELANVLGLPRLRVRIQTRRSGARSSDRLPRIEASEARRPRPVSGRVARAAPLRRSLPDVAPASPTHDAEAFASPGPRVAPRLRPLSCLASRPCSAARPSCSDFPPWKWWRYAPYWPQAYYSSS